MWIHPEKCGYLLHSSMMIAFVFQWNFHRDECAALIQDTVQDCGLDPAVIRLSKIKRAGCFESFTVWSKGYYLSHSE